MAAFYAWQVSPLRFGGNGQVVAGRLQGSVTVTLEELGVNGPRSASGPAPYELFGPGDVQGLAPGTITRRFPPPGAVDAEDTKRALIEFSRADTLDLPWRYSPDPRLPAPIRPWLVLVVGTPADVVPHADGYVTLSVQVQADHPLSDSHCWAHVHEVDNVCYSRILSPALLAPRTAYVACLVPAYALAPDGTLHDAWPGAGGGPVRLRCYDSWRFRTGDGGDFRELARRLRTPAAGELNDDFGRARLEYRRRGPPAPGEPDRAMLPMAGALQRVSMAGEAGVPVDDWVASETAALTAALPTPAGRWVLSAPVYHAPFVPTGTMPVNGWAHQLQKDPRHRGAAGLGAWAAIAWQDRIALAAAARAGDLEIARERIGNVALGLEASRSLWFRHLPADPVDQLAVLGIMLGRMPVDAQYTVASALAGRTPGMGPAIWSSAARRACRPGPARCAWTQDAAKVGRALLQAAAACPPDPHDDPDAIWHLASADPAPVLQAALRAAMPDQREADALWQRLRQAGVLTDLGQLAAVFGALAPPRGTTITTDSVLAALRQPPSSVDPETIGQWASEFDGARPPCRPVHLDRLGQRIAGAVDPFAERPPVVSRVLATLPGLDDIAPVEIEPELDLPLWHFLSESAPDWLLPGVGDLAQDRVLGMATHAAFVHGLLVGANQQVLGELRWRNLPIAPRWSPMRKFWQRAGGEMDIVPIKQWSATSVLGASGHAPANIGTEAVVLFRTPLFRRYPATVVYLYRADPAWTVPAPDAALEDGRKRFPTFTGRIGTDVTFFGFAVAPSDLAGYWVVLEEPPAGYRFYGRYQNQVMPPGVVADGAAYASATFAPPVRVMIGRLELT